MAGMDAESGLPAGPGLRVAVVGAGAIGAAVARELAVRGASVTVFARGDGAVSTSAVSFAWLNAHRKREPAYHRLNVAGMAEHHALVARLAAQRRWHYPTGHLEFAATAAHAEELERDVEELRALDYPAEWVTAAWARQREPAVRIPADARRVAFFASEGYALPTVLIAALLDAATVNGARVETAQVTGLARVNGRVRVELAEQPTREFDAAVICAGRWSGPLADGLGLPIPLVDPETPDSAATAYQLRTGPTDNTITRIVTTSIGNFRPDPGGRLLFQAHDLDRHADPTVPVPADIADELRARLTSLVRAPASVESVIVGQRALPVDGRSIVGYLDPDQTVYAAVTHSGLTLGPLLGRLVAEEMLLGRDSLLLRDFRPDRFATAVPTGPTVAKQLTQGGD